MGHEVRHLIDFDWKSVVSPIDTITQKPENTQFPEEVIVFTLESSDNECPGVIPEEKVSDRK